MKRDARLHGLSSDHHSALVLARTLAAHAGETGTSAVAAELKTRFERELEPHFRIEEEVLLPALLAAGEVALVQRTTDDHGALRRAVAEICDGNLARMTEFADRLVAHIRFEERDLFPRCEQCLPEEVLEEAARRTSTASRRL